jgi:hypothetical protein
VSFGFSCWNEDGLGFFAGEIVPARSVWLSHIMVKRMFLSFRLSATRKRANKKMSHGPSILWRLVELVAALLRLSKICFALSFHEMCLGRSKSMDSLCPLLRPSR